MPKTLADLISEHALPEAQAVKWDAVAAILNAPTIVIRDATPVTYAMLARDLGDKERQLVAGTLRAIAKSEAPEAGEIADAHSVLLNESGGLALETDNRQEMVDKVAAIGGWPDSLRDAIKAKGVRLTSLADNPVTAEQCQRAWIIASCIDPITTAHSAAAAKLNNAQASLGPEHTNGLTLEELQARCDAIGASAEGTV